MKLLDFLGPAEVLLNQPTVLNGVFDPNQIFEVTVVAEDKYKLPVDMDLSAGVWKVNMAKGFNSVGARWIRIKGLDVAGKIIDQKVAYFNVSNNPQTAGKAYTVRVVTTTFFKSSSADSSTLTDQQKVLVRAGQTFTVSRYGYDANHLKVELTPAIAPVGTFGYFYEPHVQIFQGNTPIKVKQDPPAPDTPASAQMTALVPTLLKMAAADSSTLPDNQKVPLQKGQTLAITGYACVPGHFRVSLAKQISGFSTYGYVYKDHVQLKDSQGKVIAYDPNAFSVFIAKLTVFKKELVSASQLPANKKITLQANTMYGVAAFSLEQDHLKVSLTEELPGFGNTGYLYSNDIKMMRAGKVVDVNPSEITLNVPYFSQRDNPRLPWATCNVTSIAMVLAYYGQRSRQPGQQLEDELYQWCLDNGRQQTDNGALSQMIAAYGYKTSFSTTRRWAAVKNELTEGRPVVLGGYFTHGGHIITVIGFNDDGYLVNDPWGDAMTGYRNTEGRRIHYPNDYVDRVAGPDGGVWAHFIAKP